MIKNPETDDSKAGHEGISPISIPIAITNRHAYGIILPKAICWQKAIPTRSKGYMSGKPEVEPFRICLDENDLYVKHGHFSNLERVGTLCNGCIGGSSIQVEKVIAILVPESMNSRHISNAGTGPGIGMSVAKKFGREGYSVRLI
ncbi:hypothetical protein [Maribacter sp. 2-571]|uniref:hypothetical protein n=1 Tax=Maribacter sp. 2-571 TaxID=3417569 RepID=UPI003D3554B0